MTHLGTELLRLRARAGLSQMQLAEALGCTNQWIGQLEGAVKSISLATAQDLDVYFKTEGWDSGDGGHFTRLHRAIKKANLSRVLLPGFEAYLERESSAITICCYATHGMPGLLQTEEYARGTMSDDELPETLDARVAGRMERREILNRGRPPHSFFVIDEAVFHRPVGGPTVMAGQLDHLIGFADSPRVQIHVLPYAPVVPTALEGGYMLLSFEDENDLAYVETASVGQLIEKRDVVANRRVSFSTLMGGALSRAESVTWMKRLRKEHP
ncbi:helix-turn-helix domain-containing protein [Actinocorallia lasiicapitis]